MADVGRCSERRLLHRRYARHRSGGRSPACPPSSTSIPRPAKARRSGSACWAVEPATASAGRRASGSAPCACPWPAKRLRRRLGGGGRRRRVCAGCRGRPGPRRLRRRSAAGRPFARSRTTVGSPAVAAGSKRMHRPAQLPAGRPWPSPRSIWRRRRFASRASATSPALVPDDEHAPQHGVAQRHRRTRSPHSCRSLPIRWRSGRSPGDALRRPGTHWALRRLSRTGSARHPALIAGVLYRDFQRGRDDATVVVGDRASRGRSSLMAWPILHAEIRL